MLLALKMKIILCLSIIIIIILLISVEFIDCSSNVRCSNRNLTIEVEDVECKCDWRDISDSRFYCPETGINIKQDSEYWSLNLFTVQSFPDAICGCLKKDIDCPELQFRFSLPNDIINKTKEVFKAIPQETDLCTPVTKQYDEGHLLNPKALNLTLLTKRQITREDISKVNTKQLQCPYELSINITSGSISNDKQDVIVYKGNYFLPGEYAVVDYVQKYEPYGPARTYRAEWNHVPEYIRGCVSDEPRNLRKTRHFMVVSVVNDGCINYWIKTGNHSFKTVKI